MAKTSLKAPPVPPASQPSLPASDRLLTEAEVAQHLNCTICCLQAWRQRGGGPEFVKAGFLVRYRPQAIIDFEVSNTRTTTSDPGPARPGPARLGEGVVMVKKQTPAGEPVTGRGAVPGSQQDQP